MPTAAADLGGSDQLLAMEVRLIDAFSGASTLVDHLNARIISGAEIDAATVQMYASSVSAMVRVARRQRRATRQVEKVGVNDCLFVRNSISLSSKIRSRAAVAWFVGLSGVPLERRRWSGPAACR
jgi:hypothetical protein